MENTEMEARTNSEEARCPICDRIGCLTFTSKTDGTYQEDVKAVRNCRENAVDWRHRALKAETIVIGVREALTAIRVLDHLLKR
jgi:hypothetical protein